MNVNPGGQIRGKDCFDRVKELKRIWKSLEKQSVLLTAPRRVGKTTILYNLYDNPQKGWIPIFTDLEKCSSPEEFMLDLFNKGKEKDLLDKTSLWFRKIIENIEEFGSKKFTVRLRQSLSQGWKDFGNSILQQFVKNSDERKLLLLLDEFPLMLFHIMKTDGNLAREVLHWARDIRQDVNLGQKIRFVFAGSIGIDIILKRLECHHLMNDIDNIILSRYSDSVAEGLIKELLVGEELFINKTSIPPSIVADIQAKSDNIPFFIHMLIANISRLFHGESIIVSPELVSRAYQEGVLGNERKKDFESFYERLKDYYTPEEREAALIILGEIAKAGEVERGTLFQSYTMKTKDNDYDKFDNLMGLLAGDFYVDYDSNRQVYSFWSTVLRDWWRKYKS